MSDFSMNKMCICGALAETFYSRHFDFDSFWRSDRRVRELIAHTLTYIRVNCYIEIPDYFRTVDISFVDNENCKIIVILFQDVDTDGDCNAVALVQYTDNAKEYYVSKYQANKSRYRLIRINEYGEETDLNKTIHTSKTFLRLLSKI